jgi:hypothetical protein
MVKKRASKYVSIHPRIYGHISKYDIRAGRWSYWGNWEEGGGEEIWLG